MQRRLFDEEPTPTSAYQSGALPRGFGEKGQHHSLMDRFALVRHPRPPQTRHCVVESWRSAGGVPEGGLHDVNSSFCRGAAAELLKWLETNGSYI